MKLKIVVVLLLTGIAVQAQLRLPAFFSDHMVLQRNGVTKFEGWAKPGRVVALKASWLADTIKTTSTGDATWTIELPVTKETDPQVISIISDGERIILNDVLMGEVWLCSGQSNMQWSAQNKLKEITDRLPTIRNNRIRFLQVPHTTAQYPQSDMPVNWKICDSLSASVVSAIGYFFAEKLNKELDVPIGIISAAWGGTAAEVWTPAKIIKQDSLLKKSAALQTVAPRKPHLPGKAWNAMIAPLVDYNIAGVLWYQGENNVATWYTYERLFTKMINAWRKEWGKKLPFYYAQIAPYTYKNKDLPKAAFLREAQTLTMLNNPGDQIAMVVTSDLVPDVTNIHPTRKKEVADRFADIALKENYKVRNGNPYSPLYRSMQIAGTKIVIDFHFMENENLQVRGKTVQDIYIAGNDKVFYPAKAVVNQNKLVVSSPKVKSPVAVRYAFTETALTETLYSSNGLPVSLFRTDNWNDTDVKIMEQ